MTTTLQLTRCSWCGLPVLSPEPPRCRKCNAVVCDPFLRDCWEAHWSVRHTRRTGGQVDRPAFRRIEDTKPI